jgi:hypothetical protein
MMPERVFDAYVGRGLYWMYEGDGTYDLGSEPIAGRSVNLHAMLNDEAPQH